MTVLVFKIFTEYVLSCQSRNQNRGTVNFNKIYVKIQCVKNFTIRNELE